MTNSETNVNNLVINELTKAQYNNITTKSPTELYFVTDEETAASYRPPLLSTMWSDHLINDMSWLRADNFGWQSGETYKTVYDKLVEERSNATVSGDDKVAYMLSANGFKICDQHSGYDAEQAVLNKYNTDGIAWYYILDTTNKRFKLPRTKFGFEGLRTNVGDDIAESLPNIRGTFSAFNDYQRTADGCFMANITGTIAKGGTTYTGGDCTLDASRSSSTYQDNAQVQERATQMYLYFYVGEYSQTAIEQTAGLNAEMFNGKADVDTPSIQAPYLKTSYVNGTSGYNIWSNGYCEQWGRVTGTDDGTVTVAFTKTFKDASLSVSLTDLCAQLGSSNFNYTTAVNFTTTSMQVCFQSNTGNSWSACWKACGYLAAGQY